MEQKFIKREPNSTILATKVELWLEQDSANVLKLFAEDLHVAPEYIVEYLLDILVTSTLPIEILEDIRKINGAFMGFDAKTNTSYKLVKVEDGKNLPK